MPHWNGWSLPTLLGILLAATAGFAIGCLRLALDAMTDARIGRRRPQRADRPAGRPGHPGRRRRSRLPRPHRRPPRRQGRDVVTPRRCRCDRPSVFTDEDGPSCVKCGHVPKGTAR